MSRKVESQQNLWNTQHKKRGAFGLEGKDFASIPNRTAVDFAAYLPKNARILELGCANGRDARWLAGLGHSIVAVDFAKTALDQMMQMAQQQKVAANIFPLQHDFSSGNLPFLPIESFDGFYARSSLHTSEGKLHSLIAQITSLLKPGGIVVIEGKDEGDHKIRASKQLHQGLVVNWDEGGHVRRVWNPQYFTYLCSTFDWKPIKITSGEDFINTEASFIRLIAHKSSRR